MVENIKQMEMRTSSIIKLQTVLVLGLLIAHVCSWLFQSNIDEIPKIYLNAMNNHSHFYYATFYSLIWALGWICSSNTNNLFFRITIGLVQEVALFIIFCKMFKMNMADWGFNEKVSFAGSIIFTIASVMYMDKINERIKKSFNKNVSS